MKKHQRPTHSQLSTISKLMKKCGIRSLIVLTTEDAEREISRLENILKEA